MDFSRTLGQYSTNKKVGGDVLGGLGRYTGWRGQLLEALDSIQAAGKIAAFNHYPAFTNPGLTIEEDRLIPLPLCENDAQAIKSVCRQAPFGRGDETLVDTTVRNTWELDPSQFRLANPQWASFLESILKDTAKGLGLTQITAKPHKLLLYEQGSFFKRHKDSEKERGMIGTLVVCLPSQHEGADVDLSFGSQHSAFATAPTSKFDLSSMAWFSDVTHEVKELRSGYRLVLTYKIFGSSQTNLSASSILSQTENLKAMLVNWRAKYPQAENLMYPLDHQYTKSSLSLDNMKGRDRAVCSSLQNICSAAGFYLMFAHMTHEETEEGAGSYGYSDDDEEGSTTLDTVYAPDGSDVASGVSVELANILGYSIKDKDPDSEEEGDFTGNESAPSKFRYHKTVALVLPKTKVREYLEPNSYTRPDYKVDRLIEMVCKDLGKSRDHKYTRQAAVNLLTSAATRNLRLRPTTFGLITKWALELGETELLRICLRITAQEDNRGSNLGMASSQFTGYYESGRTLSSWSGYGSTGGTEYKQEHESQVLKELIDYLSRSYAGKEDIIHWDHWLQSINTAVTRIGTLEAFCERFRSSIQSKPLEEAFASWSRSALDQKLEAQANWMEKDHPFALKTLKSRRSDTEWVLQRFLPRMVPRADRNLLWALLHSFSAERSTVFTNAKDLYLCVFKHSGQRLCISEGDFGFCRRWDDPMGSHTPCSKFIRMLEESYAIGAGKEALDLLEKNCARLVEKKHAWSTVDDHELTNGLLVPLVKMLEKLGVASAQPVQQFLEVTLRDRIHARINTRPVKLEGWSHEPLGCKASERCRDCPALNQFLTSPTDRTWHFSAGAPRRSHIEMILPNANYSQTTLKNKSPHTLVVTKRGTHYDKALERWQAAYQQVEHTVGGMRSEYLKGFIGEEKYRELILLQKPGQEDLCSRVLGVKREADYDPPGVKRPRM
ncbi:hypothetical protein B0J13DRAFT_203422 [Dactylonectria estremocensis]|uniref:Prolyl 4-hydroxylase alpha subunit Fe(2+) 2OG dioxygenase domain-containing protein n=1 Tax=Dactylonectria estremocensis TaxID=1079267 RepID=A0A9P9DD84_9HYPO|nr:hypothetical protein B0J13DRAFT_203422 [Dactylonectria estremocensis]